MTFQNGTLVAIKSSAATASRGNFKLYRAYHEKLRRQDGWYCFVVYRPRRSGLTVVNNRIRKTADLPTLRWHGGGNRCGIEQVNLALVDGF